MINHHESNIADKIQEHTDFSLVTHLRHPSLELQRQESPEIMRGMSENLIKMFLTCGH